MSLPYTWHVGSGRSGCTPAPRKRQPSWSLRACMLCPSGLPMPQGCSRGLCSACCQASTPRVVRNLCQCIWMISLCSRAFSHLEHLRAVIGKLVEAGLKLKPTKCHFVRTELEYLSHVITREGLKTNPRLVEAVREFPVPKNLPDVRRFLGLTSYYRRFIRNFAKVASPLHYLTKKDSRWLWTLECETAFQALKEKLTTAPVVAYPNFHKEYILETDASTQGLGAVLSQVQSDEQPHPVAFASRALSRAERNYGITELETLAVVWGFSHFYHLLYGNSVTVYTDHTSVRAVLECPNPTAKHARWWTRVYGRGVKSVRICYRAGRERSPVALTCHLQHLVQSTERCRWRL